MKLIINENERGFLFKNGKFVKMIKSGKYNVIEFLGETFFKIIIGRMITIKNIDINVLLKDKEFEKEIVKIDVPDNSFALHFEDDKIIQSLKTGTYYFWNIYHKNHFEIIDISQPKVNLTKEKMSIIPIGLYTKIEISEGEVGLLYFDGKFEEELQSGSHYFWNGGTKITCRLVDMRIQQLDVNSQEILTADKVTLRLNFICTFKIKNAIKINNLIKDYNTQIYVVTQLAIREYVGKLKFDELLEQKECIAGIVLEKLKEKQDSLFIEFFSAGLKDVILPGDIRDIMNTVLIAEKNAQANVILRREEVASTRSLLNTAKLMEENTTLYKLKELEYLEKICDKVGNISVGNGNLLGQLSNLLTEK